MAARSIMRGFAPLRLKLHSTKAIHRNNAGYLAFISSPGTQTIRTAVLSQTRQYSTPLSSQSPDAQSPTFRDLRSQLNSYSPPPNPESSTPSKTQQKKLSRYIIYAGVFLVLGGTIGKFSTTLLAPPPLPAPHSEEDEKLTSVLRSAAEALPISKSMTGGAWESWDAYTTPNAELLANRLTSGPLAGYAGIGYQRVFCNRETGEYVVLVWLGRKLGGWPGVVHGGLLATLLDECLARAGMRGLEGGVGVTARLEVGYKRPVGSAGWWVLRSWREDGTVGVNGDGNGNGNKAWARGQVEDLMGRVYTEGRALYVVPKNMKLSGMGMKF